MAIALHPKHLTRQLVHGIGLVLTPPRCPACRTVTQDSASLCQACWKNLHLTSTPHCQRCGLPLAYSGYVPECNHCLSAAPMPMGRSALVYDSGSRELILRFKHGDQLHLTPLFSRWLYAAGHDFWADTHLIMPVPLHWRRRFSRRYNQAAVLAQATATIAGLPVDTISLQRQRHTPPQKGHSQASRTANVADAFLVKNATAVTGKNIVLVDDVWTTGATLTACTHVLQACGAKNVRWLTLARVLPKSLQNTYSHIAEEAI